MDDHMNIIYRINLLKTSRLREVCNTNMSRVSKRDIQFINLLYTILYTIYYYTIFI